MKINGELRPADTAAGDEFVPVKNKNKQYTAVNGLVADQTYNIDECNSQTWQL